MMDAIFKLESHETFQMAVMNLLKQNHTSSKYSNADISTNMIEAAKEDLRKSLILANFDVNELKEHILSSSSRNQERVEEFITLLETSKAELFQSILTHFNSEFGDTVTECMWSLKLVLGTSVLKVMRYPLLQLVLSTVNNNGYMKQKLYEFNKETLLLLIKEIERCLEVE